MNEGELKFDFDEDHNIVLYEIDSAHIRRKVATKFKDGRIVFEPSYDKQSDVQKDAFKAAMESYRGE